MKKIVLLLMLICFSKTIGQTKNPLIYSNEDVKIELKTQEKGILKHNQKNPIIIRFENLDPRMTTCAGPGLRMIKPSPSDKNETLWEINLTDSEIKEKYTLHFSYKKNDTFFTGKFEIPIE